MGICHLVKLKNSSLGRFDRAGEPALSLDSRPRHQKHKGVVPNWDSPFPFRRRLCNPVPIVLVLSVSVRKQISIFIFSFTSLANLSRGLRKSETQTLRLNPSEFISDPSILNRLNRRPIPPKNP